jgi:hypothetical protein
MAASSAFAQDAANQSPSAANPSQDQDRLCRDNSQPALRFHDCRWRGPEFTLGMDLGVSVMNEGGPFGFDHGVGAATDAGPAWGLRIGVEFFRWLAIEARYVGMYNAARPSASPAGRVGFLTSGGELVVRIIAPLPFVHPYLFGGGGYYDISLGGTSSAKAGSVFTSSSQPGIPLGFGIEVPLTWHISFGAEATYHFLIGESFSSVTASGFEGGDLSTFKAVLRVRL